MNPWVKFGRAAALFLLLVLLGGGALLFFWIVTLLGGMLPLYAVCGITALGAAGLIALFLCMCGYLPRQARRWVGIGFLCAAVAAGGYMGHGYWREQLPTLDDRSLLLQDYLPFAEGTKSVALEEPATLHLLAGQTLRLDGATALYPVYSAFAQAVYPQGEYPLYGGKDGFEQVTCSGTTDAYERLLHRETDLIFVAGPSDAQLAAAEALGMTLHLTPIGREAFVFFVNSKNPVTSLTVEQIQKIYTGEIRRWSEVGGNSRAIRPFQRAKNSGSQTALERLMDGLPLLEPEKEDVISAMDGIIHRVASYRNYANALGFSFRFYASEMVQNDQIRLLALNGVAPTPETIRDESYPIVSSFYAVTASPTGTSAPETKNADLAAFLEWILSPQGQHLVEQTGYTALR